MTTLDAVDYDLNRHLASIDRAEAREGAVEQRAAEMLEPKGDYFPFTALNLAEALAELACNAMGATPTFAPAAAAFAAGDHKTAGELIGALVHDYWARNAEQQAEHEVDTDCQRCFGRGCMKCDPPDRDDF